MTQKTKNLLKYLFDSTTQFYLLIVAVLLGISIITKDFDNQLLAAAAISFFLLIYFEKLTASEGQSRSFLFITKWISLISILIFIGFKFI